MKLIQDIFWIFPVNDGTVNVGIGMVISEQRKQHGIKKSLKKMQKNVIENHPIFKERFEGARLVEGTEKGMANTFWFSKKICSFISAKKKCDGWSDVCWRCR